MTWSALAGRTLATVPARFARSVSTDYTSALNSATRLLGQAQLTHGSLWSPLATGGQPASATDQVAGQEYGLLSLLFARVVGSQWASRALNDSQPTAPSLVPSDRELLLVQVSRVIHAGRHLHCDPLSYGRSADDRLRQGSFLLHDKATRLLLQINDKTVVVNVQRAIQSFIEGEFRAESLQRSLATGQDGEPNLIGQLEKVRYLKHGHMLGQLCKSMVHLGGHGNENVQMSAFEFGSSLAAALSTHSELSEFESHLCPDKIRLCLPLLFAIEEDSTIMDYLTNYEHCELMTSKVHQLIRSSSAIAKTSSMVHMYTSQAFEQLDKFKACEAKMALINILRSLKTCRAH
ncbi:hypothetical protein HDE_10957 [Halotydeus destructor]|nr:hypothetical protein HDE_10957 [Halotydeus destructor]